METIVLARDEVAHDIGDPDLAAIGFAYETGGPDCGGAMAVVVRFVCD